MENIRGELINFLLVAVVFLFIVFIVFRIFLKKFKFNDKNVEVYGLLLNLDNLSLISLAANTINYLFLVWCTITFQGLKIIYVAITLILVILGDAVIDNFKGLWISILLTIVNCGAIEIIYLMFKYITTETFSFPVLLILCLTILFVFLYYTYNLLRSINNIVVKNKYLGKKKYMV